MLTALLLAGLTSLCVSWDDPRPDWDLPEGEGESSGNADARSSNPGPFLHLPLTSLSLELDSAECAALLSALSTTVSHLTTLALKLGSKCVVTDAFEAFFIAAAPSLLHLTVDIADRDMRHNICLLLPICNLLSSLSGTGIVFFTDALLPNLGVLSLRSMEATETGTYFYFLMRQLSQDPKSFSRLGEVRLRRAV